MCWRGLTAWCALTLTWADCVMCWRGLIACRALTLADYVMCPDADVADCVMCDVGWLRDVLWHGWLRDVLWRGLTGWRALTWANWVTCSDVCWLRDVLWRGLNAWRALTWAECVNYVLWRGLTAWCAQMWADCVGAQLNAVNHGSEFKPCRDLNFNLLLQLVLLVRFVLYISVLGQQHFFEEWMLYYGFNICYTRITGLIFL